MAGTCVDINIKEVKELAALFAEAKLSLEDKAQLLKDLAAEVLSQTLTRFDTQLDPEGRKWKPIAESTRKFLNKYFPYDTYLLVRTGELRDSVEVHPEGSETISIGSAKEYAEYIQDGTSKMPARPLFGIGTGDYPELIRITTDFLSARLSK